MMKKEEKEVGKVIKAEGERDKKRNKL